ncbi:MAG: hypothetical protein MZV65_44630 [Chromatiales bacterium]|nr:hypothetical protein [Chromatiales bacterium]
MNVAALFPALLVALLLAGCSSLRMPPPAASRRGYRAAERGVSVARLEFGNGRGADPARLLPAHAGRVGG